MKKIKSEEEKLFTNSKYAEFICDFEDKWLQYSSAEQKVKVFFGNIENAKKEFNEWKKGKEPLAKEREINWSK